MSSLGLGSSWTVALAIGAALLTLGAGLCLFDGGHADAGEHGMSLDLCLGMLIPSVALPLLASLSVSGWAVVAAPSRLVAITPIVPAPPPKFAATA